jgi:outer membrane receptor protein involved in Fe transport
MNMHTIFRNARLFSVLALMIALFTLPAMAQRADGTLRGTVTDTQGAVVPNAKVIAINTSTGVSASTTTTSAGSYSIPNLQIGNYTVTIEAPSFAKHERKDVQVLSAQVVEVSPRMKASTSSEVVEVVSGAEVVQTESSQLSASFSDRAVTDIPTTFSANGFGSVQNLSVFVPNTTTQLGGTSGNGGSVGGLRGRQNSFSIDGATNTDTQVSVSSVEVIQDAVAEFTLSTNQFSAEYGSAAGGQFNVVTKTGTNSVKGGLWWYNSNRHLNATSSQEAALIESGQQTDKSRFDYNRVGGNVGGPIIADKLFFYGAYEFQATGSQPAAPAVITPTAAGLATIIGMANPAVADILAQFPVAPAGDVGTVLVNGVDIPVGNAIAQAPSFLNQHDWIANVDYNMAAHQLRFRHLKNRVRAPALGGFPQDQFNAFASVDNRRMIFDDVWSVNSRMVNDFKASFGRLVNDNVLSGIGAIYPTLIVDPNNLGLVVGPANNLPQNRTTNWYQFADTFSWVLGAHSVKFGGEYRWVTGPSNFLQNSRGQYSYTSLQSLVNDVVPDFAGLTFQGIGSPTFVQNAKSVGWFIQDDWKITPRLTLNLGLRYDFFGVPRGAAANALNAVSDCPTCGPDGLFWHKPKDDFNNYAPRVGFAWDPTGSGKWAVRGGVGMAFDHTPANFYTNGAPPQFQAVLTPQSACAGTFSAPPVWCDPDGLAGPLLPADPAFLANNGMQVAFIPPATVAGARAVTANLMSDNVAPQVYTWSLGVQREIMKDTSIELRYLGTRATHLPVQIQLNAITAFELGAQPMPTYFSNAEVPANVAPTAQTRQQFLNFRNLRFAGDGFLGVITAFPDIGSSRYHSGSIDINRRMSKGLLLRANYTFSRAQDNATNDLNTSAVNPRRPQNGYNIGPEWGRSTLDVHHKGTVSWVYDLPKLNVAGFGGVLLNGWQWNGSYLYQGGQPITPQSGVDANGNLDGAGDRAIINPNATGELGTAANFVCRNGATGATFVSPIIGVVNAANPGGTGCLAGQGQPIGANGSNFVVGYVAANPDARFVQARDGAVTNSGRNIVNSAPIDVWNMGFFKNTKISERVHMQFRADIFNVFNHPNFALGTTSIFGLNANALTASYGQVANANFLNDDQFDGGGRVIQLGLKVTF